MSTPPHPELPAAVMAPDAAELFDPARLERVTRGRLPTMQRIVRIFVEQHRDDAPKLAQAASARQWPALQLLTHALKGSASQVGAGALGALAARIDAGLVAGREPLIDELAQLAELLMLTVERLQRWLAEPPASTAGTTPPSPAGDSVPGPGAPSDSAPLGGAERMATLRQLQQLLENQDGRALALVEDMRAGTSAGTALLVLLDSLAQALLRFDFDAALSQLQAALGPTLAPRLTEPALAPDQATARTLP
ncbi:MAG: hypothetical protein RIQ60_3528 [Pseudomonadota bacterium]|jgi:HPt (histidine-containing phosphotransfer) domain-containing protein